MLSYTVYLNFYLRSCAEDRILLLEEQFVSSIIKIFAFLSKVQQVFRKAAECARPVRLETPLDTARGVPTPLYLKIFWILLK